MLRRKIESDLENWKQSKYGLLIDGARQIGKTYIIRKFIKANWSSVIELNLIENRLAVEILNKAVDSDDFMLRLSSLINKPLVKNETVIFIDEVQEFKEFDIITMMKFLVDKGDYRFVLSGSLLGVEQYGIESWPQGYMMLEKMYPLDFEEFLWANGINEDLIEKVKESFLKTVPVPDFIHDIMLDLFRKYLLVGGMPDAVVTYIDTKDLYRVSLAHKVVEQYYEKDITKYADEKDKILIKSMYELLPSELNSQSKRFSLKDVPQNVRNENLCLSFGWFTKAGIAIPAYNVSEPKVPLELASNHRLVKLFHEDVGILTYLMMNPALKASILNEGLDMNFGSIYENAVAQLLITKGRKHLFYYNKKGVGEADFLIEKGNNIQMIEVKSGKNYSRHSALNNFTSNEKYNKYISQAIVLTNENVKAAGIIKYLPIYMAEFI